MRFDVREVAGRPGVQGLLVAAATFVVYAAGACRTIYVGDSGELVTAAATLGIPHPSGYPLYVLLGKLWITLVPAASAAYAMSLFSAAFAGLACGLLYLVVRRQNLSIASALFAALTLAFSPSFWSQANVQRVYSLNAFFVVAVCACALEWHRSLGVPPEAGKRNAVGWMALAAFLAGLGAANHTVMGLVGLAVGVFAVISESHFLLRPRHLAACAGAGVAGLVPYAYLPIRSRQDPRLDWGDPETLEAFLDVVLRRDFWHRAWIESPSDFLLIAGDYLRGLGAELLWAGAALAAVAAVWGWKRSPGGGQMEHVPEGGQMEHVPEGAPLPVLLPLLVMAANLWAVGVHGSRSDIFIWHRYYIPSYVMAALLAAWGLELALHRWGRRALVALAVPVLLLVLGWTRFDRSDFRVADDFSRQLLATLPPGAHLAASDDNILFVLIYLHLVEGLRPDIDLIMQGVGDADLGQLRFDPDDDPLFFTHHPNWNLPELEVVPVGLVFRTARAGTLPELALPAGELAGVDDPAVPRDYLTSNLIGHYHYMLGITFETRDWPRAAQAFERAAGAASENDVLFYNLGLIYRRNGLMRRSLAAFERSAEINPRHIPSGNPVRAIDRVAEVRPEVERLDALEADLRRGAGLTDDGGAAYHRGMADLLAARGESLAAGGHRLRLLEAAR